MYQPTLTHLKQLLLSRFLTTLLLFVCFFGSNLSHLFAQPVITYPTPASNLSRGVGSGDLDVMISFPSNCTPENIVAIQLGGANNNEIEYVPGSLAQQNATGSVTISEYNISNLNTPEFKILNVTNGSSVRFKIKRRANCGNVASLKDVVIVNPNSSSCNATENDLSVNSYGLTAPSITISNISTINNPTIGNTYNRNFTISNGGLGCLDTLYVWVKNNSGAAIHNSLKIGTTTLVSAQGSTADSILYKIYGTLLGNNSQLCNNSTPISFTENFTLTGCNLSTNIVAGWKDFRNTFCDLKSRLTTIISNAQPNLAISLVTANPNDYTFTGESKIQTIRITNTGNGEARNIAATINTKLLNATTTAIYLDTAGGWNTKNAQGNSLLSANNFTNSSSSRDSAQFEVIGANNCSTLENRIYSTTLTLPNSVVIPVGSFIDIDVKTKARNFTCASCVPISNTYQFSGFGLNASASYNGVCDLSSKSTNEEPLTSKGTIGDIARAIEHPSDVAVDQTFNWSYSGNISTLGLHTNGQLYIGLKLSGTGLSTTANSVNITYGNNSQLTVPVSIVNDSLLIGPIAPATATNMSVADFNIPLKSNGNICGDITLTSFVRYRYSSNMAFQVRGCQSTTLKVHCPGVCPKGGATPLNFSLKRISYGLKDDNNDRIPDASVPPSLNLIDDHHAVNGDTLLATWNIKVYPNNDPNDPNYNQPFKNVYIDSRLTLEDNSSTTTTPFLNPVGEVEYEIYPVGSATPIIGSFASSITNTRYVHYRIDSAKRQGLFQANDSIVVRAKFALRSRAGTNLASSGTGTSPQITRFQTQNYIYSSYATINGYTSTDQSTATYTCDKFNDYMMIGAIIMNNYPKNPITINNCTNQVQVKGIAFVNDQNATRDFFRYEYRPSFTAVDEMWIIIPSKAHYKPNSNVITIRNINRNLVTSSIPDANIEQIDSVVKFKGLKTLMTTYGGTIQPMDEYTDVTIDFEIEGTCDLKSGTYKIGSNAVHVGDGKHFPLSDYNYKANANGGYNISVQNGTATVKLSQEYTNGYNIQKSNLNYSGSLSSTIQDGILSWNLSIVNDINVVAPNHWVYLSVPTQFSNVELRKGNTLILPNQNGFYELGDLSQSGTANLKITASSNSCNIDTIQIFTGYNCTGYPQVFDNSICSQSAKLYPEYENSEIQLSVVKQPLEQGLCSTNEAEFLINSAQQSFVDNPQFVVTLPVGLEISGAQIEYPVGSGNWQVVNPITSNMGELIFNVEDHSELNALYGSKGLPGTDATSNTAQRQAKLKLIFTTECTFVSGTRIKVQQRATRPCGEPISSALGYNATVRTAAIDITGMNISGNVSLASNLSNNSNELICGNAITINATLNPQGGSFTNNDTLLINLDKGLDFDGVITADHIGFTSIGAPILNADGTKKWKVKVHNDANTPYTNPIIYSFGVKAISESGCGGFNVFMELERTGNPLTCGPITCAIGAKKIIGSSEINLIAKKDDISITNVNLLNADPNQFTKNLEITIHNKGMELIPANEINLDMSCLTSNNVIASARFPNAIPAGTSVTGIVTVTIPTHFSCINDGLIKVVANPSSNDNCLCEQSAFTLGLPLPLEGLNITALQQNKCEVIINTQYFGDNITNQYQFELERSRNAKNFVTIDTALDLINSWTDQPSVSGKWYYRLKAIDLTNQQIRYSNITSIDVVCELKAVELYPNPTHKEVSLKLNNYGTSARYSLTDVLGRVHIIGTIEKDEVKRLDIHHLPSGIYTLTVDDGYTIENKKLVIQD